MAAEAEGTLAVVEASLAAEAEEHFGGGGHLGGGGGFGGGHFGRGFRGGFRGLCGFGGILPYYEVSKAIQKLVVGVIVVKSEGVFPYRTHYVLATDEEVERLVSLHSLAGVDAKKADGGLRLVPARTTLHALVGAEVA